MCQISNTSFQNAGHGIVEGIQRPHAGVMTTCSATRIQGIQASWSVSWKMFLQLPKLHRDQSFGTSVQDLRLRIHCSKSFFKQVKLKEHAIIINHPSQKVKCCLNRCCYLQREALQPGNSALVASTCRTLLVIGDQLSLCFQIHHIPRRNTLSSTKTAPTKPIWLVVWTPLKNISQLGWLFPIYGKIKNVPNHQPAIVQQVPGNIWGPTMTQYDPFFVLSHRVLPSLHHNVEKPAPQKHKQNQSPRLADWLVDVGSRLD